MKTPSFGIYANQSDKRWNTFIEEMNERFSIDMDDNHTDMYFGINLNGELYISYYKQDFQTIITLDDYFAEGSVYRVVSKANWDELEGAGLDNKLESWDDKPTFKRGDRILVWDDYDPESEVVERIGLIYIEGVDSGVIVVEDGDEETFKKGGKVGFSSYERWKPLPTENPERQKLQQEIEQLEKELNVKRDKLKEV